MKVIDIQEAHVILLDIAKAFAEVCENNKIPYYMLGGTMLGAIRHKGFIPWDDDMDFGVPREYYNFLIDCLEKDLPKVYRCCTYMNGRSSSVIFKIEDSRTIINDVYSDAKCTSKMGLNIDIFPLDYCAPSDSIFMYKKILTIIYRAKYAKNPHWSFMHKMLNKMISIIIPWSIFEINQRMDGLLKQLKPGPYLSNVFGAWGIKECIPIEWYGNGVKYMFENTEFCGLRDYDKYLTQLYGDYMVPPKGDKHIHLEGVYWK